MAGKSQAVHEVECWGLLHEKLAEKAFQMTIALAIHGADPRLKIVSKVDVEVLSPLSFNLMLG